MINYIKGFFSWLRDFIRKWGVYGILAIVSLYSPLIIGLIIQDEELISFGWRWTAIWALPIPPAWLAVAILAGFYKWLYVVVIKGFYYWIKEKTFQIQRQTQFGLYFTSEEMDMMLEMGKELKKFTDKEKSKFNDALRKQRLQKIDEQWTKTTKEVE